MIEDELATPIGADGDRIAGPSVGSDGRRCHVDGIVVGDDSTAGSLAAGRDPHDKALHDLVGELSTRSEEFRRRWGSHDVRLHGAGVKHFHHTTVGNLELAYESVDMISDPGLTLTIYVAEPASPTARALDLLASWNSTIAESDTTISI